MIQLFSSTGGTLKQLSSLADLDKGSWVHVQNPTAQEIDLLACQLNVEREYIQYPLDEDERSRIDQNQTQTLIILNYPVVLADSYDTYPLGILLTDRAIVTICAHDANFIHDFAFGKVKQFDTYKKVRFVLQIFYAVSLLYMSYLRQISRKIDRAEDTLRTTTKNQELLRLLSLSKSLVYFSTALRANHTVLERIERIKYFRLYDEDRDLLDDTLIENRQSIEMATIYGNILAGTMDAYGSIISNNLNGVMKFLTTWTIVLMIPNLLASFYGMNIKLPMQDSSFAFPVIMILCLAFALTGLYYFTHKKIY